MDVTIKPHKLSGSIVVPPSKSLSHRAIIAACLSEGKSVISNIIYSEDILATLDGMEALGAKVTKLEHSLVIEGSRPKRIKDTLDCRESGSTVRFLIPIALTVDEKITFVGKNNLVKRPLDSYLDLFEKQHISYEKSEDYLPLTVYSAIQPGIYELRGDISSQFITGLLFSLPLLKGDSKILITTPLESKGYIDLTLDILKTFGIRVENHEYKEFLVYGNQEYKAHDYYVEGDYSQAAFYLAADMLGNNVSLLNMNPNSLQGDEKIIEDIRSLGGIVWYEDTTLKCRCNERMASKISFAQSPDLGPALAVVACLTKGVTCFYDASRLRIKESDRITDMRVELEKLGAKVKETSSTMTFEGVCSIEGGVVDSHNDHRVCMALAILASVAKKPITIKNAECIKKSYPSFFEDYCSLGGIVLYDRT